jgi:hypothetical protein
MASRYVERSPFIMPDAPFAVNAGGFSAKQEKVPEK